jgi:3-oxoacyl-[acyl-carrier-protein] synthase II
VSGLGIGTEQTWEGLRAGRSGIAPITLFDAKEFACRFAGEVKDFDPSRWIEKKEIKKLARFMMFAIAASDEALSMAGLKIDPSNAEEVGVFIGSGIGGFEAIEREHKKYLEGGPSKISPFFIPAAIVNLASGHISIRTGAKGP